jgi:hypothetical protein
MITWVQGKAEKLGFTVVSKSNKWGKNKKIFLMLGGQRGGEYKKYINKKWKVREKTQEMRGLNCVYHFKLFLISIYLVPS